MWRFLGGVASALLLVTAGFFLWRAQAQRTGVVPTAPAAAAASDTPMTLGDIAGPPAATERTREQKRFSRYDHDKNGIVSRDEYLMARHKAFAKLDTNGDGKLSFDEYAVKTIAKFTAADRDRNSALNAAEFATTRVVRKAKPRRNCPPTPRLAPAEADEAQ